MGSFSCFHVNFTVCLLASLSENGFFTFFFGVDASMHGINQLFHLYTRNIRSQNYV